MTIRGSSAINLVIPVEPDPDRWVLEDDETMPVTPLHDRVTDALCDVLRAWVLRTGRDAYVGKDVALRWDRNRPGIGVDPDVYVVEPPPPGAESDAFDSICTWKPGHRPPLLAIEVVSKTNSKKDYSESPDKYAAAKVPELWVFDPEYAGPRGGGGPHLLQLWRGDEAGQFVRVYRGDGPVRSETLGAWVVVTDRGRRLRVADDAAGQRLWPTAAESERALKEAERAARKKVEAELAALREQIAGRAPSKRPARKPRRA